MTTEPSQPQQPQQPPEKVARAAESNNLGRLERIIVRAGKKRFFAKPEVTGHLYDFEEGIIYVGADEVLHVYPWDKVVRVYLTSTRQYYNRSYSFTTYGATLILENGGKLALTGLFIDPKYADDKKNRTADEYETYLLMVAGATIVSESQLPGTLDKLRRGEELAFGDIRISLAGVHAAKGLVPWNTINDVQVRNGAVHIKQAGKFFPLSKQPVGQIPNLPLFNLLASALRSGQQR